MNNYDGLKHWRHISLSDVRDYWTRAGLDLAPLPWIQPPQLGLYEAEALMLLTSSFRLYELGSYREFWRIMVRDGKLKLVFSDGVEEPIIEVYVLQKPIGAASFNTVKSFFKRTAEPVKPEEPHSNVIPFKKP